MAGPVVANSLIPLQMSLSCICRHISHSSRMWVWLASLLLVFSFPSSPFVLCNYLPHFQFMSMDCFVQFYVFLCCVLFLALPRRGQGFHNFGSQEQSSALLLSVLPFYSTVSHLSASLYNCPASLSFILGHSVVM